MGRTISEFCNYLHTKEVKQALILARSGSWHGFIRDVLDSLQGFSTNAPPSNGLLLRIADFPPEY